MKLDLYKKKAYEIRKDLFEKFYLLNEGHPGSVFSILDVLIVLYYGGFIRLRNNIPYDDLIISKGHATVGQYPILKDLTVDRTALDRIIKAGGYISVNTGNAQDANALPIPKPNADEAFMSATCIGCGACVASCKNASAALFTSAKITHLSLLPQGQVEREQRALDMVSQMDVEGFGACTSTGTCSASCPKEISLINIATMNREFLKATLNKKEEASGGDMA